jgi:hypothetical protein
VAETASWDLANLGKKREMPVDYHFTILLVIYQLSYISRYYIMKKCTLFSHRPCIARIKTVQGLLYAHIGPPLLTGVLGGPNSLSGEGMGGPNSDDWIDTLELYTYIIPFTVKTMVLGLEYIPVCGQR